MKIAACPLIDIETEGERLVCDTVACESCEPLANHLEGAQGVEMICSGCLQTTDKPTGFHTTGGCERCGKRRMILMPCQT
jgi:hypothetical protein